MLTVILNTIDDLPLKIIENISTTTQMNVYTINKDVDIPYSEIKIMITYGDKSDWDLLYSLTSLKWVQIFQTGVENTPYNFLNEKSIKVTNVRDIYGNPISEFVFSILLYKTRELDRFIKQTKLKSYDRTQLVDELTDKTIGIFGTGAIGKAIAKKAKAFDMHVIGYNQSGKKPNSDFDELFVSENKNEMLKQCDYIILILPLNETTENFLDKEEFRLMKKNAYLINVGRGGLINDNALINALNNNLISGATLDVFREEPLPIDSDLWNAKNIIISPHLSGKTKYFYGRCLEIFDENFKRFINKRMLKNEIN